MNDYGKFKPSLKERMRHNGNKLLQLQQHAGSDGFVVRVNDSKIDKNVIIQKHSNPINELLEDMKLICTDDGISDIMWGSEITIQDKNKEKYLAVTEPSSNGIYSICKIRKFTNTMKFSIDGSQYIYDVILNNGLMYNDSSYINSEQVFSEDDTRALLVKFDENINKLKLFMEVVIGNETFKIVKIDKHTMIHEGDSYGVVQITIIRTVFGDLFVNDVQFEGVLRYNRMKERVYNSKAREVLTDHNILKSGDYVTHNFIRDSFGNKETRIYIVRSLVDMRNDYDTSFALNCDVEFNILKDDGTVLMTPAYIEDNRTMLQAGDRNNNVYSEYSKYQCLIQENEHTLKIGKEIQRIIIKDRVYKVVGTDNISLEGAIYVGLMDSKFNPSRDNKELGIADYYKNNSVTEEVISGILGESSILFGDNEVYKIETYGTNIHWSVVGDYCSMEPQNNTCVVSVIDDYNAVGNEITLMANVDGVEYFKNIRIKGW